MGSGMSFSRVTVTQRAVLTLVGIAASAFLCLSSPAEAARRRNVSKAGAYSPPYAAMVVDTKTGKILYAENPDALRFPASITKVMTLYLLFEQLETGRLKLGSRLTVSANAASQPPSKIGVRAGETISVEDAIKALVTKSANDVAVVIAENVAGSEGAFAQAMTRKAKALGMSRTVYYNPNGLPNNRQVTTARDLVTLGRAIQDRFPTYYQYFQTHEFDYKGARHANHNRLLGRIEGVDGIKTGYTRASGFNLLTSVKTDNRQIVAVVLGGRSGAARDNMMANLIDTHLQRAYAGNRATPPVGERRAVASAPSDGSFDVETTAAVSPPAPRQAPGQPLAINSLRPAVAAVSDAASTTTPGQAFPTPKTKEAPALPKAAQAFAAPSANANAGLRVASLNPSAPVAPSKTVEKTAPQTAQPAVKPKGWVIQLAATPDEASAKDILDNARSRSGRTLTQASSFTEKVVRDGATLYRARFSGFAQSEDAQNACNSLKKNGFSCFASRG